MNVVFLRMLEILQFCISRNKIRVKNINYLQIQTFLFHQIKSTQNFLITVERSQTKSLKLFIKSFGLCFENLSQIQDNQFFFSFKLDSTKLGIRFLPLEIEFDLFAKHFLWFRIVSQQIPEQNFILESNKGIVDFFHQRIQLWLVERKIDFFDGSKLKVKLQRSYVINWHVVNVVVISKECIH